MTTPATPAPASGLRAAERARIVAKIRDIATRFEPGSTSAHAHRALADAIESGHAFEEGNPDEMVNGLRHSSGPARSEPEIASDTMLPSDDAAVGPALAALPASDQDVAPDVVAKRCPKPGCGAQRRIGHPCTDWDCPQATLTAEEHRAALQGALSYAEREWIAALQSERRKREEAEEALMRVAEELGQSSAGPMLYLDVRARLTAAETTNAELRATVERAEQKADILEGLLTAKNVWTDYGNGWRIHFSFSPGTSNEFLSRLNVMYSDRARARSETEAR